LKKHFGTDGIRGIPEESLTEEIVSKVSASVEKILKPKSIALITDTRSSCEVIAKWISNGFSSEVHILNYGILPSGSMPILLNELNHDMGIIISASHNPSEYNGIKLIDKNGSKLADEVEISIEDTMDTIGLPSKSSQIEDSHLGYEQYKNFLDSINDVDFLQFNLVIDSANGSAYKVIKDLVLDQNATATFIANEPNGENINEYSGATNTKNLINTMKNGQLGISFDGDADRLIMIDENKEVANGDVIIALLANYLSETKQLENQSVVSTVMSNYGFKVAMKNKNFNLIETPVGDKYVAESMKKHDAVLGGEQSGHIIFSKYLPVGDGLVTFLLTLKALNYFKTTLAEFRKQNIQEYPQKLVNIKLQNQLNKEELEFINQIAFALSNKRDLDGRYLIRNSGTEPLLRVLVEAKNSDEMDAFLDELLIKINGYLN
jgi:phosphoglucosamine mutase|tara:strand:+ start:4874 stop:6178 length:1305 start_codon:yes stop_codon:yes gene_type:complete